jgi:hypothetical protein
MEMSSSFQAPTVEPFQVPTVDPFRPQKHLWVPEWLLRHMECSHCTRQDVVLAPVMMLLVNFHLYPSCLLYSISNPLAYTAIPTRTHSPAHTCTHIQAPPMTLPDPPLRLLALDLISARVKFTFQVMGNTRLIPYRPFNTSTVLLSPETETDQGAMRFTNFRALTPITFIRGIKTL